ncbi:MAG: amidohydrolase family protein [Planctomycetes bacterium]|nr:amidohydrolase family protein [Planctomycetota bacterium]
MKRRLCRMLRLVFPFAGFAVFAPDCGAGGREDLLLLENVRVFAPTSGAFGEPLDILIREGRIEALGDLEPPPEGAERRDAGGRYAIAGLWDSHVHFSFLTLQSDAAVASVLEAFLGNGITCVRDVGGPLEVIASLSQRVARGEIAGPTIHFSGPLLSQPPLLDMLKNVNEMLPGSAATVESVADVDAMLDRLAEQGATLTKAIGRWDPALFRYYLDAAEARSLRVVLDPGAPLFHRIPVDLALALGVPSIEHAKAAWPVVLRDDLKREHDAFLAAGDAAGSGEALMLRIMSLGEESLSPERVAALAGDWAHRGACFCPTLVVAESWLRQPLFPPAGGASSEEWERGTRGMRDVGVRLTRELAASGVRILVGQDGADPEGTLLEMELLAQAGVSPVEILRGATSYPAAWLGLDERCGSLERGKAADVVILDRDPLERIENIRSVWLVVRNGAVLFD